MAELDVHAGRSATPIVIEPVPSQAFMQLKGTAARRGEVLQPADLEAARKAVADLATRDRELLEQLAAECLRRSPNRPG